MFTFGAISTWTRCNVFTALRNHLFAIMQIYSLDFFLFWLCEHSHFVSFLSSRDCIIFKDKPLIKDHQCLKKKPFNAKIITLLSDTNRTWSNLNHDLSVYYHLLSVLTVYVHLHSQNLKRTTKLNVFYYFWNAPRNKLELPNHLHAYSFLQVKYFKCVKCFNNSIERKT